MVKKIKTTFIAITLAIICAMGCAHALLPNSITVLSADSVATRLGLPAFTATVKGDNATVKLLGVLPVKNVALNVLGNTMLYPGGMAFGVKFFTEGVLVVGLTDIVGFGGTVCPARDAGIDKGDIVLSVNGTAVSSATALRDTVAAADGKPISMEIKRGTEVFTATVYPALCAEDNSYKAGLWVRDSTAGIGTVTYINAANGSFGGLGHGICDSDTGTVMPLGKAVVVDVDITGVRKGAAGNPGELKGTFDKIQRGTITQNTETGVYGTFSTLPQGLGTPMQVGLKEELKTGKAFIYTTLSGNTPQKYEIAIEKIYKNSGATKNFLIKVTDSHLLKETGGIVQGMSGSPVIQNGKIVGAVTHVLINDPTRGYGIFIENMLAAAE